MRKGKMKNSIVTIAMAMMLSVTAVVGFGTNAKASSEDSRYAFSNVNEHGDSSWRDKETNTKVYVHPCSGPTIKYWVQGKNQNNVIYYSYGDFRIPTGTKGSITNLIWENRTPGCNIPKANLQMERGQSHSLPIDTTGYWSPDSIGTYTIYG